MLNLSHRTAVLATTGKSVAHKEAVIIMTVQCIGLAEATIVEMAITEETGTTTGATDKEVWHEKSNASSSAYSC